MVYCVVASEINSESTTSPIFTGDSIVDASVAKFLPYLKEIQKKLLILLIVILSSAVLGFFFYQKILMVVMNIFNLKGITIVLSSPYQFIDLAINTGIATGVIIAFPLFVYYLMGFLKPALAPNEYSLFSKLVPLSIILFIIGFAFGGWVMQFVINLYSQTAIDFNITNIWDISHFFSQTILMGVCLGLLFEIPVIITLLIRLRIVKKKTITNNRRIVYAAIVILAALLPPSDVISLSILTSVPLLLFEVALLLNKSI